jgi:hypothetical protein
MSANPDKQRSEADVKLESEIRKDRTFSLAEAIGRLAGPGSMKGASPVTRMQQASVVIEEWLRANLADTEGALQTVLLAQVTKSDLLLNNYDQPLVVLAACCQRLLSSDFQLKELVRDTDVEWGRAYDEKPIFDKEGSPPQPGDPYTAASVRQSLSRLMELLAI